MLDRDLVTVTGPDAFSFLQSLVSQDVDGLADGAVVSSLLLTPKGKVQSWFRLMRVGDDAWLDVEAGFGESLREALERFRLRVMVKISVPEEPWGMVALRGAAVVAPEAVPPTSRVLPVAWSTAPGVDVIGPRADLVTIAAEGLDAEQYERDRIDAGIPRLGVDLDDSTIPQEAWLDRDSVSFTKGCYLGQELVARIDSRGHVNRVLRRLRPSDPNVTLARDAEVEVDGKVVGQITSAIPGLALGYVRREVDPPAAATVAGTPAMVEPLPGRR
ncbi:MAG: CAF17-like 4Fe-4S cluster assembly/insertion protein YgfZ [Acidimicrobiia bacterium]